MPTPLDDLDFGLRCSAAALLLVHLLNVLCGRLPPMRRWTLALFLGTVMAYLICSHPVLTRLDAWFGVPVLSLCLMSAPALWLSVQTIFQDDYRVTWPKSLALMFALALGWMSIMGWGGLPLGLAHKAVVIAFVIATLWEILKDWRSDLVSQRRRLRAGVTAGLAGYVLVVTFVELAYMNGQAPAALAVLHIAGINLVAILLAVLIARQPLEDWLRASWPANLEHSRPQETSVLSSVSPAPNFLVATNRASTAAPLTAPPPMLDRKAALQQRLLHAMGEGRAYAREGLTLAQLADQLDTSPVQLREAINENLGYRNFNDFLHHYRIDEAAQRLTVQDLPILSIALDVGYGSIGPFNRAFKQLKGMTPSEFRSAVTIVDSSVAG